MNEEEPESVKIFPLSARLHYAHRVGKKCVLEDLGGGWFGAHGVEASEPMDSELDPAPLVSCLPIGPDPKQSRVFYHYGNSGLVDEVVVVGPTNVNFRPSSQGYRGKRTLSFHSLGEPVPEVLALYAQKVDRYDERLTAVTSLELSFFNEIVYPSFRDFDPDDPSGPTFGETFSLYEELAQCPKLFSRFVEELRESSPTELASEDVWDRWEKVANKAAENFFEKSAGEGDDASSDDRVLFIKAIKLALKELNIFPSQFHVREKWDELLNAGPSTRPHEVPRSPSWRKKRDSLGFAWLPAKEDWKKIPESMRS
ncbi:hypothetical protein [Roseibacillus persicicus]|uniref:hypothetical protein n=1 Tax=Roseibacillus persicicus TaxID=454148 RepID=UPI00280DC117|nr:hypothetical protein [Roseibacillus persicicus]MDQ8191570.1 hypothetical protein [Roseibacillus persicicus]